MTQSTQHPRLFYDHVDPLEPAEPVTSSLRRTGESFRILRTVPRLISPTRNLDRIKTKKKLRLKRSAIRFRPQTFKKNQQASTEEEKQNWFKGSSWTIVIIYFVLLSVQFYTIFALHSNSSNFYEIAQSQNSVISALLDRISTLQKLIDETVKTIGKLTHDLGNATHLLNESFSRMANEEVSGLEEQIRRNLNRIHTAERRTKRLEKREASSKPNINLHFLTLGFLILLFIYALLSKIYKNRFAQLEEKQRKISLETNYLLGPSRLQRRNNKRSLNMAPKKRKRNRGRERRIRAKLRRKRREKKGLNPEPQNPRENWIKKDDINLSKDSVARLFGLPSVNSGHCSPMSESEKQMKEKKSSHPMLSMLL